MSPIYWLEIIKPITKIKHLSNHYILKFESKFMVFTSKPIPGLKCHYIATPNIQGDQDKPQFIVEKIHTIDPLNYVTKISEKGAMFYTKNQAELQPFLEKMQPIIEKIS